MAVRKKTRSASFDVIVVGGGELMHRGTNEEIFPLIMADTLGSCPVMKKEAKA